MRTSLGSDPRTSLGGRTSLRSDPGFGIARASVQEASRAIHNLVYFAYSYDVAGNLTTATQTVGSDVITTTNVYDGINRPIEVSQSGAAVRGLKANYAYSPTGEVTSIQRSQSAAINSPATTLASDNGFYSRCAGSSDRDRAQVRHDDACRLWTDL
jgi:hypothetical protein